MKKAFFSFIFFLTLSFFSIQTVSAATNLVDPSFYVANGSVNSFALDDNYVYFAGNYNYLGKSSGNAIKMATNSIQLDPVFPVVKGTVRTIVPDGSGGWYLGGSFTKVGSYNIIGFAHVFANGSVDTSWNFSLTIDVTNIIIDGNDMYVGGWFNSIGGQSRERIAKINISNKSVDLNWNPGVLGGNPDAFALYGNYLYVAGSFTSIGGQNIKYLARVNKTTGVVDTGFDLQINYAIRCIKLEGEYLYLGGNFTSVNGINVSNLAKIALPGGSVDSSINLDFPTTDGGSVIDALEINNQDLYVGGYFNKVNNFEIKSLVKLNKNSGVVDSSFNNSASNTITPIIKSVKYIDNAVFVGGKFNLWNGQAYNHIVKLNPQTGIPDSTWNPSTSNQVLTIGYWNKQIYIGGDFISYRGLSLNGIGRLNRDTGILDNDWNVNLTGSAYLSEILIDGANLYIRGSSFNYSEGQLMGVAKFNKDTGEIDPSFNIPYDSSIQHSKIAIQDSYIYVSGEEYSDDEEGNYFITPIIRRYNKLNGVRDESWDPIFPSSEDQSFYISNITSDSNYLYVCGSFNSVNGLTRHNVARFSLTDMSLDDTWVPEVDGSVFDIFIANSNIYIGGAFSYIGTEANNNLAKLDTTTGQADTNWHYNSIFNSGSVFDIVADANHLYFGGNYIGSPVSPYIVYAGRVDIDDGTFDSDWNSGVSGQVLKIMPVNDVIYIGGYFSDVSTYYRSNFTRIGALHQIQNLSNTLDVIDPITNYSVKAGSGTGLKSNNSDLRLVKDQFPLSDINVDMTSDRDWSIVNGDMDIDNNKSVVANLTSAPGAAESHALYIPKEIDDIAVMICPEAVDLSQVTQSCPNSIIKYESDPDVEIVTLSGQLFWKVESLTGTGGLSLQADQEENAIGLKDTLSRLMQGVPANHEILFSNTLGIINGADSIDITFDPANQGFNLDSLLVTDIDLYKNTDSLQLASTAGNNVWGVVIDPLLDKITLSAPVSGDQYIQPGDAIKLKIGLNAQDEASGVNQIINPINIGLYSIEVVIHNETQLGPESGTISIPIVDSDQVNVTGYVNTFINFDIDTSVVDTNCAYNGCLTHENGEAGTNYTVDLGELNSTWVNKSNSNSVMHTQGGSGIINSIYLDLTTNAYEGAIVYVSSANAGLQGPATNLISTVTDGEDIVANDGAYGFQLTDMGTVSTGTITRNSNCIIAGAYCALPLTNQTVFTTEGRPLDTGRLRMDIAAAASYTNNPGLYTDTLTFTVVATY